MDYLLIGLTKGGTYALIAVGYTMVYGIIQLINFAHGEIYMFGAFFVLALIIPTPPPIALAICSIAGTTFLITAYTFLKDRFSTPASIPLSLGITVITSIAVYPLFVFSTPFYLAVLVSIILTACLGMSIESIAYRPLRKAPRLAALITAIGMSLFLQNIARLIWTARTQSYPDQCIPSLLKTPVISEQLLARMGFFQLILEGHRIHLFGETYITLLRFIILVVTLLMMLALHLIIHRTKIGKAMRACAQDKVMAGLMGIDVNRVIIYTFAIGSAMGAVAGILNGLANHDLKPTMGYYIGVKAFAAAVLGGIGNVPGAMLGGFVLGIAESLAVSLGLSRWMNGVAYAVMISFIILRPSGILGKTTVKRA
ncbi:MAG: branched-chain amino acid ABC transporter permease [bacterium]|nr:branched-chain amino acid ABC transporter permease [bacterium]